MKYLLIIMIIFIASIPISTAAGLPEESIGKQIIEAFELENRQKKGEMVSMEDQLKYCHVIGVVVGVISTADYLTANNALTKKLYCAPSSVSFDQKIAIIKKHLNDHPAIWHYDPMAIVLQAFNKAFPCK